LEFRCENAGNSKIGEGLGLGHKHGHRSQGVRGDKSPTQEFGAGTLMQIVPQPQILSYRYKNERSMAFKIRQNPFSARAVPRTQLGKLTMLPQTP